MTKWFEFRQNNSGGSFDHDPVRGIGLSVYVEADDAKHANYRAERIGLYFNGCDSGSDCECCGDRWSECWPDEEGSDTIEAYNWKEGMVKLRGGVEGEEPFLSWDIPSYIHPMVGDFTFATRSEYDN